MEQSIWELKLLDYHLYNAVECNNTIVISLPENSEILSIVVDNKTNLPVMFVLVNNEAKKVNRTFELFANGSVGESVGANRKYIGSYKEGSSVGHLFERLDKYNLY